MIFLSDTSTERCFVMLADEGKCIASLELNTGLQHGSTYQVAVEKLLETVHLKPANIDVWACVTGPGSFTGLRMAVAATKVYAYLHKKLCIAVNALEARAQTLLTQGTKPGEAVLALPILDARNERAWTALYTPTQTLKEVEAGPIAEILHELAQEHHTFDRLAIGGIKIPQTTKDLLETYFPGRYSMDVGRGLNPDDLALHLQAKLERGEVQDPQDLQVTYFSQSQAERELSKREGKEVTLPLPEIRSDV